MSTSQTYFANLAETASLGPSLAEVRCLERILPAAEAAYRIVEKIRRKPIADAQVSASWDKLFGAAAALVDVCECDALRVMCDACEEAPLSVRTGIIRGAVSDAAFLALNVDTSDSQHPDHRVWAAETLRTSELIDPAAFLEAVGSDAALRHPSAGDTEAWISFALTVQDTMPSRPSCPSGTSRSEDLTGHGASMIPARFAETPGGACHAVEQLLLRMEDDHPPYEHARTMVGRLRSALAEAIAALEAAASVRNLPPPGPPPAARFPRRP
ncbi:hypothetical protein [Methylobacterium gregans]|uniref:Uncharacterized protein n=1 Tax=Methylobacterium gregans TaxID=374424 RepID=A0AA37HKK5_9HYPH|nr:hypothetical protein [Methylobacterium gregans]MDQ0523934.1 hypothetical protein [Methylobacterium gregans]GJD77412.1 hypothetical protein NBEOAGPD_0616 [Methylobacterium gregans]GLS56099.1 hypothetical protein GCM10007886_42840 [Methylobacterium gregans]